MRFFILLPCSQMGKCVFGYFIWLSMMNFCFQNKGEILEMLFSNLHRIDFSADVWIWVHYSVFVSHRNASKEIMSLAQIKWMWTDTLHWERSKLNDTHDLHIWKFSVVKKEKSYPKLYWMLLYRMEFSFKHRNSNFPFRLSFAVILLCLKMRKNFIYWLFI